MWHSARFNGERQTNVGIDVDPFTGRKSNRFVVRRPFVDGLCPHDILNTRRKFDNLLGERIVEHPARDHWHVLNTAITAGQLDADAHVSRIDARDGREADEDESNENEDAENPPFGVSSHGPEVGAIEIVRHNPSPMRPSSD